MKTQAITGGDGKGVIWNFVAGHATSYISNHKVGTNWEATGQNIQIKRREQLTLAPVLPKFLVHPNSTRDVTSQPGATLLTAVIISCPISLWMPEL